MSTDDSTVDPRLDTLERQQAYLTQALAAAVQGKWTGDGSVEAYLYAINPGLQGTLTLNPPAVPAS
jgi:hypothetical protein